MFSSDPKTPLYRTVVLIAGLAALGLGFAPILRHGDLFYKNWFGELVFSPLAIIFGLVMVFAALFRPSILDTSTNRTKR